MALPAVVAGVSLGSKAVGAIGSMFGGPSKAFLEREAASNDFFQMRDQVVPALLPYLSEALQAEYWALSFHKTDFNTRKPNQTEINQIRSFIQKAQASLTAAPDNRLLEISSAPGSLSTGTVAMAGSSILGGGVAPLIAVVGLGLAVLVMFK